MQSQAERLVMENLCTPLPLLPPHLINNILICYLHLEVFLHGNLRLQEINCPSPLRFFNYNVCNGSSVCHTGTLCYLCHCKEMKPRCFVKIKQYFSVHGCPCTCKANYSEERICMAFEEKGNYISCFIVRCIQH